MAFQGNTLAISQRSSEPTRKRKRTYPPGCQKRTRKILNCEITKGSGEEKNMKWGVDVDAGISSNNARRPNRDRGAKKKPAARVLRRPSRS